MTRTGGTPPGGDGPERPRAVLFDMTGTLHPQAQLNQALGALVQLTIERNPGLDAAQVAGGFGRAMHESLGLRSREPFYLFRDVLDAALRTWWPALGLAIDDAATAELSALFTRRLVEVVAPYPSAAGVLSSLRASGIATAIVSVNDEQLLQDLVDACGLRPHVDLVLSSEAARSCKPDPAIFQHALAALGGIAPRDAWFVGDMPEMDIVGANAVGIRSVLTTEDRSVIGDAPAIGPAGQPDHVIGSLPELLPLLGLPPLG